MIEVTNLQKVIGGQTVLDIQSLTILPGQTVALVGPAASGKQALLDLLTGKTQPSMGSLRVGGLDPYLEQARLHRIVGVLFGEDAVYTNLTPHANLLFHARLFGISKSRTSEILAQVGLADHANADIGKLSTSLLRRLAFGRTILHDPQVLLLFEPFTRCDEVTISLLSDVIRSQVAAGVTVLILQSDQSHLKGLCDLRYLLNQGKLTELIPLTGEAPPDLPFKIPARRDDKVILFNPGEIWYADAGEGRAYLVTAEGRLPTQFTLGELESRLARSGFFRAHRSFLVNLQHVKEVIPYTRNSFSLRLDDPAGTKIPLSKNAASELKDLLGY